LQILSESFCENEKLLVMSILVRIILDTRRIKKKTNKYPVKLRVTCQRISRDYTTIHELSDRDFDKLTAPRISTELQYVRDSLKCIERTSENVIKDLDPFTFCEFEKAYIYKNPLFRPKKIKREEVSIKNDEFDFTPFEKKFPILKEDQSSVYRISSVYVLYHYRPKLIKRYSID